MLQAFGVHTQTGILIANLNAGRLRAAAEGKLPAGVGNGMLGYTLANKKFTTTSFIAIVDQILDSVLHGDSINRITSDLQARDVRTPAGIRITLSTVPMCSAMPDVTPGYGTGVVSSEGSHSSPDIRGTSRTYPVQSAA